MKSATADAVKERGERDVPFTTISGRPINRLYTSQDLQDFDQRRDLGSPGEFPYTRGIHPSGYRGKLWTMRQFAGFGTPEESNQRYKELLKAGGGLYWIALETIGALVWAIAGAWRFLIGVTDERRT